MKGRTLDQQLKSNLSDHGTWTRLIFMVLFAVFFSVAELVAGVVVIVQFLFKLFTGRANEELQAFGHNLAVYFSQIIDFLTYHSEQRPYPWAPWPGSESAEGRSARAPAPAARDEPAPPAAEEPDSEAGSGAKPVPAKKPSARTAKPKTAKTTAKKRPAADSPDEG